MNGIGYARVSSVEQTQGTSLESQRGQIRSYAAMKGISLKDILVERCNEGRRARKAEGKRVGEVPFGYSLAHDGKTLIESGEEQEAIRLTLRLKAEGYSAAGIARELNRRGMRTKKDRLWTHVQVTRLLKRAA